MPGPFRALARVAATALAAAVLLPGCGLFREAGIGVGEARWVERRYRGVGPSTVLQLAQTALRDRYPPQVLDLYRGTLETGWVYGRISDVTRQALRQRVVVEAEADGDETVVRLRVRQETSESAGRIVSRDPDDWVITDDDPQEAKLLLARLHVLLRDVADPAAEADPKAAAGR